MSKWKDTVMKDEELRELAIKPPYTISDLAWIAKAQDKISLKAGYKRAREEMDIQLTSLADLCLEHRKGGRREVVDYIDSWIIGGSECECIVVDISTLDWQAQKKEWGI